MGSKRWIKDERGVNLIELMAVVAVAAIVTAIAVPTYFSYLPFLKVRSAARDLMSDLRYTRQQAVTKNKDQRLRFTSETAYVVECYDCPELADDWRTIKTVDLTANYSDIGRTAPADVAAAVVYFKPNGGLDDSEMGVVTDADPFTLTLTHEETGEARTIKINGVGRVWTE